MFNLYFLLEVIIYSILLLRNTHLLYSRIWHATVLYHIWIVLNFSRVRPSCTDDIISETRISYSTVLAQCNGMLTSVVMRDGQFG